MQSVAKAVHKIYHPVHMVVTRAYAHPLSKPALTHGGVGGLVVDWTHAITERLHFLERVNLLYAPWHDIVTGGAALALALVIYSENAHHVLAAIEKACTGD